MKLFKLKTNPKPFLNVDGFWQLPLLFITSNEEEVEKYEEISSIIEWENKADWLGLDFLTVRKLIKLQNKPYSECNPEEKTICSKYLLAKPNELIRDFPIEELGKLGKAYHQASKKARQERWDLACSIIYNDLPILTYTVLSYAISPTYGNLALMYKDYGVKGKIEDYDSERNTNPSIGIVDYLLSRDVFSEVGLSKQPGITISGKTLEELALQLVEILA